MYTIPQQQFIAEAKSLISKNPQDRLSKPVIDLIKRNNFVADAHCHIFDGHCIDPTYFLIRLLNVEDSRFVKKLIRFIVKKLFKDRVLKSKSSAAIELSKDDALDTIYNNENKITKEELESFFEEIETEIVLKKSRKGFDVKGAPERIMRIYNMLNQGSMQFVYNQFKNDAINTISQLKGKELLTIVLGMDLESGWEGSHLKSFQKQADELLELSLKEPIVPFFPIHPERATIKEGQEPSQYKYNELYDSFLKHFKEGNPNYFGVKLYPSLGYHPGHSDLEPIYEICEACNIPITVHCGGETISTFEDRVESNVFGKPFIVEEGDRTSNAKKFNEPENWFPVLEKFPKLKVNLAHFGGEEVWEKSLKHTHKRIKDILHLMNNYEGVYTDFSFNLNAKKATKVFKKFLTSNDSNLNKIKERTMFGTDYWVVLAQSDLKKDQEYFLKATEGYHQELLVDNVLNFLLKPINTEPMI